MLSLLTDHTTFACLSSNAHSFPRTMTTTYEKLEKLAAMPAMFASDRPNSEIIMTLKKECSGWEEALNNSKSHLEHVAGHNKT